MDYKTHKFNNGIRIVHVETKSAVAHCGLIINAGSRDENTDEHGMAHFIEHAIFKGTKKRKAYHVLSRLDDVGGEINAYTSKEDTCIQTSFLKTNYERALELIYDISFNSTFPVKEINKEKDVIIEEINSYKDDPADIIFDDFEELIFRNQAIGKNILGEPKSIKLFTKEKIEKFIKNNYHTNEMVICSIGDISFEKFKSLAEKYFSTIKKNYKTKNRLKPINNTPIIKTINKHTHQAHCIIGNTAYDINSIYKTPMTLLDNILGGPALNSRLNLSLREKYGYAYHVESNYSPYSDIGIFSVYFGSDKINIEKSIKLVKKEFNRLKTKNLGTLQLSKAKKQLYGQIAISNDNKANILPAIGKSIILYNKIDSMHDIYKKIEKVTANDILEVANDILDEDKLSMLIYK
ncbi:MAG: pitrilysin family protein [Bacteroidota bacterium]|nr:pitrilysin family protein [Bacteroidota bacterium]